MLVHRINSAGLWLALPILLSACGFLTGAVSPPPTPPGNATPIEHVTVADDGRAIQLDFTGGKDFDPEDPCSVEYTAWVQVTDGVLWAGVYAQPHPRPLMPHQGCDAIGYQRHLTVELSQPYEGQEIRDMSTTQLLLAPAG
jgi:hypothetical protein